jgi:hypothetical protein
MIRKGQMKDDCAKRSVVAYFYSLITYVLLNDARAAVKQCLLPRHDPINSSIRTAQGCRFRTAALMAFLCVEPNLFRRLDASFAEMKACKRFRGQ